ncbi:hypothetical protein PVAND_000004 [Polypedilum vanderplanki]|uniref:Ig-like domain-containing protein n=1 Tax=Polypedilum vanderplanki TaxID=319348 RepID=A0A9J6BIR1_POLVA|nr:hypothetical protein PVAND_000004 [Polypedilum vanderplanki]
MKKVAVCLRLTKINIPQYKFRGENAILECDYELNGNRDSDDDDIENSHFNYNDEVEILYSVKWYKDNEEFYRYVPKANPPQHSYKVDGIKVDHQSSNSKKVYLKGLTLKSTGTYRCQITAEEPDFKTVTGEQKLEVIYLPNSGPSISSEEKQAYQIGDILALNCTSGKSQPRSILTFYINDEPVMNSNYLIHYKDTYHQHNLITTQLGLNIPVDGRHFYDGLMRVKCVANLSPALWQNGRESVLHRRLSMDQREAMLLVRSTAWKMKMPITIILAILLINVLII